MTDVNIPKIAPIVPHTGKIRQTRSRNNTGSKRQPGSQHKKKGVKEKEEKPENDMRQKQQDKKRDILSENREGSERAKKDDIVVGKIVDLSV